MYTSNPFCKKPIPNQLYKTLASYSQRNEQDTLRSNRLLGFNKDLLCHIFFHTSALSVCNQQSQIEEKRAAPLLLQFKLPR